MTKTMKNLPPQKKKNLKKIKRLITFFFFGKHNMEGMRERERERESSTRSKNKLI